MRVTGWSFWANHEQYTRNKQTTTVLGVRCLFWPNFCNQLFYDSLMAVPIIRNGTGWSKIYFISSAVSKQYLMLREKTSASNGIFFFVKLSQNAAQRCQFYSSSHKSIHYQKLWTYGTRGHIGEDKVLVNFRI